MAPFSVRGKQVVITGASSGIGKELSACFAAAGAHCFLGGLPAEAAALEAWAAELAARHGVRVRAFPVDLAAPDGPERFFAAVTATGEPVQVLVNNAGIIAYGRFHELPLDLQEKIIRVNVIAYCKLMRLFLPGLIAAGEGRILNTVSLSAFQPSSFHAVYGAGKAFVQMLSEAVNEEIRGTGVRIQTLNPPYTDTPLLHSNGFPRRLWWFKISGLHSPAEIARRGFDAFVRGRAVYIPGAVNWFAHVVLVRLLPRAWTSRISGWALKEIRGR